MSQQVFTAIDTLTTDGEDLADLLEQLVDAIITGFSGTDAPTWAKVGTPWIDTNAGTNALFLKRRISSSASATVAVIDTSGNVTRVATNPAGTSYLSHHPSASNTIIAVIDGTTKMTMNSTGVSFDGNNPIVNMHVPGTSGLVIPSGTTAQRVSNAPA